MKTIEELLRAENEPPPQLPALLFDKAVESLNHLALHHKGKFVVVGESRGTTVFSKVIHAIEYLRAAQELISWRRYPFTVTRVGAEVRFSWSKA